MAEQKVKENITNSFSFGVDCSPGPSNRKRQNKDVETKPSKKKKSLDADKQTPNKKNVKRTTVTGDEYQRILQILIRQRSLQTPGVKVGSDVSDISDVDDVVYFNDKSCKFFQIKHSIRQITMAQLFNTNFLLNTENKTINRKKDLRLALYFESFINIKENSQFKHLEIEDLNFVTNQSLKKSKNGKYKDFLIQEVNGLKDDKLLYLKRATAEKYSLNVKLVKKSFYDCLKKIYFECSKTDDTTSQPERFEECMKIDDTTSQPERFEECIKTDDTTSQPEKFEECIKTDDTTSQPERFEKLLNEFLSKIRIVINYPDTKDVRNETMKEIFGDDIIDSDIRIILEHCIIHMEIELLTHKSDEYLTIEEWKSNIDRVKSLIEKLKVAGITEYEQNRLTWKVGKIEFQNESLNDMCKDLNIFLGNSDCRVFHLCQIDNVELTVVKVLSLLMNFANLQSEVQTDSNFTYCTLDSLISTNVLLNYFLNGHCKLLVIACDNENIDYNFKKRVDPILKSLNECEKKYILISQTDAMFKTCMDTLDQSVYCKKQYSNDGFKALNEKSKLEILEKKVQFQDKPISIGSIFQNSRAFAEEVIDENCLWEILNPKIPCTIHSNPETFSSLGYDRNYYIPRKFNQKNELRPINEDVKETPKNECEMIQLLGSEKTIILVGNSGEGKSTLLTHIANLLKEQDNSMWIIKVNLRIFASKYKLEFSEDLKKVEYATKIAFKMAFPNEHNKLEETLFIKGLKLNQLKVVLLLDGYNEVDSETKSKIGDFVKTIQSIDSVVQCWITTQIQDKMKVETKLREEAYFLESLSDEDQINLLVKYWKVEYSKKNLVISDNVLKLDASAALSKWKQYISDENERSFTSVSLNLKMLADVLLKYDRKLDQSLNLLDLYYKFIKIKFSCYRSETIEYCNSCGRVQTLDLAKENLFAHSVRKVLQNISAKRIILQFSNNSKKFPGMETYNKFKDRTDGDSEEYSLKSLSKIGLLTFKDGEFELSHESYVQLFFSEYVFYYFSNEQVQCFLMDHVLVHNYFQLCRRFIDRLCFNHMQNSTVAYERMRLNQTKLSMKAQSSFIKVNQSNVVIRENLRSTIKFVLCKLTNDNQTIFLKRVVKHSLNEFKLCIESHTTKGELKSILNSIEQSLNSLPNLKIMKILKEQNLFKETIHSSESLKHRVNSILGIGREL